MPASGLEGFLGVVKKQRGRQSGGYHPAKGGAVAVGLQSCLLEPFECGLHPGDYRNKKKMEKFLD